MPFPLATLLPPALLLKAASGGPSAAVPAQAELRAVMFISELAAPGRPSCVLLALAQATGWHKVGLNPYFNKFSAQPEPPPHARLHRQHTLGVPLSLGLFICGEGQADHEQRNHHRIGHTCCPRACLSCSGSPWCLQPPALLGQRPWVGTDHGDSQAAPCLPLLPPSPQTEPWPQPTSCPAPAMQGLRAVANLPGGPSLHPSWDPHGTPSLCRSGSPKLGPLWAGLCLPL